MCSRGNLLLLNPFSSRFPLVRGWNSIILLLLGCTEQGQGPLDVALSRQEKDGISCSGEPQLGIIKASLTSSPSAGPGFYPSGRFKL